MSVTIILPAGATEVTVREIPRLFAEALHPEKLDGTEKIVTYLMRQAKNPDAIPAPRCEPLTPDDWALLMAIWSHLPVYKDGMHETEWSKYAEAFQNARQQPDWQLLAVWGGTALQDATNRVITADEHRAAIPRAVAAGELIVRSRSRLPIPEAIGEQLESGIVTLDDFASYARGLGITVQMPPSYPAVSQPVQAGANRHSLEPTYETDRDGSAWPGVDSSIVEILRDAARRLLWAVPELGRKWESNEYTVAFLTDDLRATWRSCAQKRQQQEIYTACEQVVLDVWRNVESMENIPSTYLTSSRVAAIQTDQSSMVDETTTGRTMEWNLITPTRYQGYGRPLYEALRKAKVAGLPCPKARDVLDVFKKIKPPEIAEVMSNGIKYFDSDGNIKIADLRAIQKTIGRFRE